MRNRKTFTSVIVIFLTFMILSSITKAVTIKDSTVSVNINDKYRWIVTKHTPGVPCPTTGDKYNLTVKNIYGAGGYLNVDVKLDYFNNTDNTWSTPIDGLFLTFNETLDVIEYQVGPNTVWGWVFVIPTPLNLTLIGKYINSTYNGFFASMSILNTTLTLVHSVGGSNYKYTYNNNGTLTKFTIELGSLLFHEMVIEADVSDGDGTDGDGTDGDGTDGDGTDGDGTDGENGIPFGNSFILITIMGTLICILSIRRKIDKN